MRTGRAEHARGWAENWYLQSMLDWVRNRLERLNLYPCVRGKCIIDDLRRMSDEEDYEEDMNAKGGNYIWHQRWESKLDR